MTPISPECLVKIMGGAVEYAGSFGFRPHPEFRHTGLLLAGIEPAGCLEEYSYGQDGKPFYIRGPNETPAQAKVILERIKSAGGEYVVPMRPSEMGQCSVWMMWISTTRNLDDDEEGYDPLGLPER